MKKLFACSAAAAALALPVALAVPGAHAAPGTAPSSVSASASPSVVPTCQHTAPASAPRQLLSQASPGGEILGNQVAVRIDEVIKAHEALDATARPTSGLPLGLDQGILGVVGDAYAGFSVVVDPSQADGTALLNQIRSGLPSNLADTVDVVPSCRRAAELATAWRALSSGASGAGTSAPGAFDLDPATETIEVLLGTANAAAASAVEALAAPGLIHARGGAGLSRGSRLADTPTPGHWGGARISSTKHICTAGFTVKRRSTGTRASLTAGHCGSNGDSFSSGQYYFGTMAGKSNFPDYDQALLTGSTYAPSIWTDGPGDTEDVRVVKGAADPAVGQTICSSGSYLKALCGLSVRSTSSTYCDNVSDPSTCTTYLLKADKGTSVVMIKGDSGGPFYTKPAADSATVRGIVIAGSDCPNGDNCTGYVWGERYLSIAGHLGVDAVIG